MARGLQVREGGKKGVYVENLSEVAVGSVQDVVHLLLLVNVGNDETTGEYILASQLPCLHYRELMMLICTEQYGHCVFQGAANRKVAATNMNRESSRSHSVFTCTIESKVHYSQAMSSCWAFPVEFFSVTHVS